MSEKEDIYKEALMGKRIPILTLDHKWHRLFTQTEYDKNIRQLEEKLNELLKKQGKFSMQMKEVKRLKKKLLQEIMEYATEAAEGNAAAQKKTEENSRLVSECNEKIEECEEQLIDLPREIDQVNHRLMLATMENCYRRLKQNEAEIEEAAEWIAWVREELKMRLVRKQEQELMNQELYSYMHDIFGADVINIFDMKYKEER